MLVEGVLLWLVLRTGLVDGVVWDFLLWWGCSNVVFLVDLSGLWMDPVC